MKSNAKFSDRFISRYSFNALLQTDGRIVNNFACYLISDTAPHSNNCLCDCLSSMNFMRACTVRCVRQFNVY